MTERSHNDLLGAEHENTLIDATESLDESLGARTAETSAGLRHLLVAAGVLVVAMLVPYTSPALVSWRAWVDGEGVPVARLFLADDETPQSGMAIATGGASGTPASASQVAEQLGDAVAANLGEAHLGEGGTPTPPAPSSGDAPTGPSVRIEPSELEGLVRELEDPEGRAMRPFYDALLRTAEREPGAITRIAHYGDSSIAGDGITGTLRRNLQQRFGDAGHGFVLIARGSMPYRHIDVRHDASGDWRLVELIRGGLSDHLYGYGGVQYRAGYGTSARFGTSDRGPVGGAVSRFELWYQAHPRGGRVELRVDRGDWATVETRSEAVEDRWHVVEVPDGEHRLELRTAGGGEARLYGMVLERSGPGVVYDSLGMVGARARRMLGFDPAHFARQHQHRETNLIVLGFGGNDADDRRTAEQFETDFRRVARLARRARPEAACLLMAPLDQAERDERGGIATLAPVPIIVEAMRRAAAAEGCAFFDTFSAMGGEGAMRTWHRSRPRLAFGDLRHATPEGYQVIGNMFYKALLKGFADYLRRSGA